MLCRRICASLIRFGADPFRITSESLNPRIKSSTIWNFYSPIRPKSAFQRPNLVTHRFISSNYRMGDGHSARVVSIPAVDRAELLFALEASLGSAFSSEPVVPKPNPLIIVISGPSGVGKDAVINRLKEVRENLHFVVTVTSREMRLGEVDGKDYFFVSKEEFLSMVERDELLEYALVYGDYKGIPKQQIREYMASGHDIVLRVDIQGAATLKRILGNSAVFVFVLAESEYAMVNRLVNRKTESAESLLVRIATAKEELNAVAYHSVCEVCLHYGICSLSLQESKQENFFTQQSVLYPSRYTFVRSSLLSFLSSVCVEEAFKSQMNRGKTF